MESPRQSSTIPLKIVAIDSVDHATMVIRSLRSSSISNQRYQRSSDDSDHIMHSIVQFDHLVQQQAVNHEKKLAIDAQIDYVVPSKLLTELENKQDDEPFDRSPIIVGKSAAISSSDDESDLYAGPIKSNRRSDALKVSLQFLPPSYLFILVVRISHLKYNSKGRGGDDSDDSDGERYIDFAEPKSPNKQRNVSPYCFFKKSIY